MGVVIRAGLLAAWLAAVGPSPTRRTGWLISPPAGIAKARAAVNRRTRGRINLDALFAHTSTATRSVAVSRRANWR